jgi:hypothetical protein
MQCLNEELKLCLNSAARVSNGKRLIYLAKIVAIKMA